MSLAPIYTYVVPYLVFAVTPVHAGVGRGFEEHVELPIQRDSLGVPCIWGSSIKGALRTAFYRSKGGQSSDEKVIFGPERDEAHEHAGAMNVLDAKLLFVPIPSIKEGYVFATTGLMLSRAKMILEVANRQDKVGVLSKLIDLLDGSSGALVSSKGLVVDGKVWLGDRPIEANTAHCNNVYTLIGELFQGLNLPINASWIARRAVVLHDGDGLRLVSRSTMALTRIALKRETKTVREGALWDEEYVPEMSMFITALLFSDSRRAGFERKAEDLYRDLLKALCSPNNGDFYLILGGHETIGKGVVKFCRW